MLGFADVPSLKAPDNWPDYDVIAQPPGCAPQRISVKGRRLPQTGKAFRIFENAAWDWFAAVVIDATDKSIRCWMLPRYVALSRSTAMPIPASAEFNGRRRCRATSLPRG